MQRLRNIMVLRFAKYFLLAGFAALLLRFTGWQKEKDKTRILFTRDIFWGETYQARLEEKGKINILKAKGYDYSLAKLDSLLFKAVTVISNLETPVTAMARSPLADGD